MGKNFIRDKSFSFKIKFKSSKDKANDYETYFTLRESLMSFCWSKEGSEIIFDAPKYKLSKQSFEAFHCDRYFTGEFLKALCLVH